MAAEFHIVPAALFEMRDHYGVIKFQIPVAAAMFVAHILFLWAAISFEVDLTFGREQPALFAGGFGAGLAGGKGRYSIMTWLMLAMGRPGCE